jgi:hypothetical protein
MCSRPFSSRAPIPDQLRARLATNPLRSCLCGVMSGARKSVRRRRDTTPRRPARVRVARCRRAPSHHSDRHAAGRPSKHARAAHMQQPPPLLLLPPPRHRAAAGVPPSSAPGFLARATTARPASRSARHRRRKNHRRRRGGKRRCAIARPALQGTRPRPVHTCPLPIQLPPMPPPPSRSGYVATVAVFAVATAVAATTAAVDCLHPASQACTRRCTPSSPRPRTRRRTAARSNPHGTYAPSPSIAHDRHSRHHPPPQPQPPPPRLPPQAPP